VFDIYNAIVCQHILELQTFKKKNSPVFGPTLCIHGGLIKTAPCQNITSKMHGAVIIGPPSI